MFVVMKRYATRRASAGSVFAPSLVSRMSFGSLRSHGQGYNSSATSSGLADLLACVAAFARSLEGRSTRTASRTRAG